MFKMWLMQALMQKMRAERNNEEQYQHEQPLFSADVILRWLLGTEIGAPRRNGSRAVPLELSSAR